MRCRISHTLRSASTPHAATCPPLFPLSSSFSPHALPLTLSRRTPAQGEKGRRGHPLRRRIRVKTFGALVFSSFFLKNSPLRSTKQPGMKSRPDCKKLADYVSSEDTDHLKVVSKVRAKLETCVVPSMPCLPVEGCWRGGDTCSSADLLLLREI